jgi:hypothetical protein
MRLQYLYKSKDYKAFGSEQGLVNKFDNFAKTKKMSTIRISVFLAVMIFSSGRIFGQEEPASHSDPWPEITDALGSGDAKSLALHFDTMVDLGLPEKDDSYSKSQGEIIMRDFFKKCPAESFKVVKKGDISKSACFAICHYKTKDMDYQVSLHLQLKDEEYLITKIKFEKQDF